MTDPKYPHGKLNENDEGELAMAISHEDGNVVLNFNTPEFASWQYNSMIRERMLADEATPGIPLVLPSSELVRHRLAPRVRPVHSHGDVTWVTR